MTKRKKGDGRLTGLSGEGGCCVVVHGWLHSHEERKTEISCEGRKIGCNSTAIVNGPA